MDVNQAGVTTQPKQEGSDSSGVSYAAQQKMKELEAERKVAAVKETYQLKIRMLNDDIASWREKIPELESVFQNMKQFASNVEAKAALSPDEFQEWSRAKAELQNAIQFVNRIGPDGITLAEKRMNEDIQTVLENLRIDKEMIQVIADDEREQRQELRGFEDLKINDERVQNWVDTQNGEPPKAVDIFKLPVLSPPKETVEGGQQSAANSGEKSRTDPNEKVKCQGGNGRADRVPEQGRYEAYHQPYMYGYPQAAYPQPMFGGGPFHAPPMYAPIPPPVVYVQQPASRTDRKLPEFDGDPAKWSKFKAAYECTNIKYKFDNSENMRRLETALKGEAKTCVEYLMANMSNVNKIMEMLERRYGRPEYVLDYLMNLARTSKKPDIDNPKSIVEFGTLVQNLVSNVIAFDKKTYLYNPILVTEMVDKLPGELKRQWFHWLVENPKREADLGSFGEWMDARVGEAERQVKPEFGGEKKEEKSSGRRSTRGPGSVNSSITTSEESKTSSCQACKKKGHKIDSCWKLKKMTLSERRQLVRDAKVCYCCLKSGHRMKQRDKCDGKPCGVDGCTKRHHRVLHEGDENEKSDSSENDDKPAKKSSKKSTTDGKPMADGVPQDGGSASGLIGAIIGGVDGALAIVPVRVKGPKGVISDFALLDTGSTKTMIEKDFAAELGLEGEEISHSFQGATGHVVKVVKAKKVNGEIAGKYKNASYFPVKNVVTVDNIHIPPYSVDMEEARKRFPYLKYMHGKSLVKVKPRIIIGGNNPHLMMAKKVLASSIGKPVATRTVLGWYLQLDTEGKSGLGVSYCVGGVTTDDTLHNLIKDSYKIDDYGVKSQKTQMSIEDKRALAIMEATSELKEDRWHTGLLWRDAEDLPSGSKSEAFRRLLSTERRMSRDQGYAAVYQKKIQEYIDKGYARKLSKFEESEETGRTWYIPHFGVTNPNKPGKFRLVFDAAAQTKGVSLNDRLLTGPDLLKPLTAVLMNFRRHGVVFCADIQDMFHRIFIQERDRSAQKFLWRDGDQSKDPDIYEMMVMLFGATSSPSSAIFVKDRNADKFKDEFPEGVRAIKEDMYMDDCLTGSSTVEKATVLRREVSIINEAGGFKLMKFISNSKEVMESIPPELRLTGSKNLQDKSLYEGERVLGLWWNPENDNFSFKLNFHKVKPEILEGRRLTKKEMCSLLMSLYDPLGFVGNYKIKGMILMQRVWRSGVNWEDFIPEDVYEDWVHWVEGLQAIVEVQIPRFYNNEGEGAVELHTFVDSSEEAYCAVSYFRIVKPSDVYVSFVMAKVKVAPLKKVTIPRLELQAALLGSKLAATILEEVAVKIQRCYYWTDSMTVLSWIKTESSRFREFVANRVGQIQELTNTGDWKWVPTEHNVADEGTRCGKDSEVSSTSRWLNGPEFLKKSEEDWPRQRDKDVVAFVASIEEEENVIPEEKSGREDALRSDVNEAATIPKVTKFSKLFRLVRATAAVQEAAHHWMRKSLKRTVSGSVAPWTKTEKGFESNLSVKAMKTAKKRLIMLVQRDAFGAPSDGTKFAKKLKSQVPDMNKLNPVIDTDGIIRVKGRTEKAGVAVETTHPILLPKRHHVVDLLVDEEHRKNGHTGKATVFNNLRQYYWIVGGKHTVGRSWTRCQVCRLSRAKPIIPVMGELPHYRLAAFTPPFTYTGVDCFGPIEVTIGRRHEKRWGVIFSCMVTRGIHLEVAGGLSGDDMLMVLSRFMDSRGKPSHYYSDNGTNFIFAAKVIKSKEAFEGVEWNFHPPQSPHINGAVERMVQCVKKVLANILKEKYPREQVLWTVFKAAENIVNSRPLTYTSSDKDDPESLTPNHFLRGIGMGVDETAASSSSGFMGKDTEKADEFLRRQWRKAQLYANEFWTRWTKEVLPTMARRMKWNESKEPITIGDMVLMIDDLKPRNTWTKAEVTKVFPGKDGVVRVVELTARDFGSRKPTCYKRSVAKICPLGLNRYEWKKAEEKKLSPEVEDSDAGPEGRPNRGPACGEM